MKVIFCLALAIATASAATDDVVPGEYMVTLRPGVLSQTIRSLLNGAEILVDQ